MKLADRVKALEDKVNAPVFEKYQKDATARLSDIERQIDGLQETAATLAVKVLGLRDVKSHIQDLETNQETLSSAVHNLRRALDAHIEAGDPEPGTLAIIRDGNGYYRTYKWDGNLRCWSPILRGLYTLTKWGMRRKLRERWGTSIFERLRKEDR